MKPAYIMDVDDIAEKEARRTVESENDRLVWALEHLSQEGQWVVIFPTLSTSLDEAMGHVVRYANGPQDDRLRMTCFALDRMHGMTYDYLGMREGKPAFTDVGGAA